MEAFLERLRESGRDAERSNVFIEYEEGRRLFPDRPCWQEPKNYPALRVSAEEAAVPCIYYDTSNARCSVYEIRPDVCRRYMCDPLRHLMSLV